MKSVQYEICEICPICAIQGNCARRAKQDVYGDDVFSSFYQWVSLCLVGQALAFYLPRALWLSLEGGLMKHLAKVTQVVIGWSVF